MTTKDTKMSAQTDEHATETSSGKAELRVILRRNALMLFTLCGVIVGFALGFGVRPYGLSETGLMWLGLPGEVFMRMLMLTILPLIVASIIAGTASLDPKSNGKISLLAFIYYLVSNATGVLVGMIMFFCIRPDKYVDASDLSRDETKESVKLETQDIFADLIRNIFPDNLVTACFQKTQTTYETSKTVLLRNGTNVTVHEYHRVIGTAPGTNVLGLIIICSILGIATGKLGEAGRPFVVFFKATSDIIIMVLTWFVWFTPVGVTSLIASSIARANNLESTMISLAMFVLMMLVMVFSITLLLVPTAYFITVRRNPLVFLYTSIRPVMAAFAPASSAIAMPDILMAVEGKHQIDIRISRFVVPFGTAISRGGSGSFILMCSLFLARLDGSSLSLGQVVSIAILAFVSTLAVPAIPSASIIAVIIILSAVSITPTNIGIIMSLEWLNDRLRATVNVSAILYGAILINKVCKTDLPEAPHYTIEMTVTD